MSVSHTTTELTAADAIAALIVRSHTDTGHIRPRPYTPDRVALAEADVFARCERRADFHAAVLAVNTHHPDVFAYVDAIEALTVREVLPDAYQAIARAVVPVIGALHPEDPEWA